MTDQLYLYLTDPFLMVTTLAIGGFFCSLIAFGLWNSWKLLRGPWGEIFSDLVRR